MDRADPRRSVAREWGRRAVWRVEAASCRVDPGGSTAAVMKTASARPTTGKRTQQRFGERPLWDNV
jgi:hypothetical protein